MPSISLTAANLASVCVEGVFYGIFLVLSFLSLRNYSRTYSRGERISQNSVGRRLNRLSLVFMVMTKPMILGTLLLFITVTFHWFCTMIRVFEAFVYYRGGSHPEDYYAYGGQKTYIGTLTSLALSLLIGDLMMIRRLWHVYEHRWRLVAFPLGAWAGLLVCLICTVSMSSRSHEHIAERTILKGWVSAGWAFTLSTNIYCIGMLICRIWSTSSSIRRALGPEGFNFKPVLVNILRSSAIYFVYTVFSFVVFQCGSNLVVVDIWPEAAGIAYTVISSGMGSHDSDVYEEGTARPTSPMTFNNMLGQGSSGRVSGDVHRISSSRAPTIAPVLSMPSETLCLDELDPAMSLSSIYPIDSSPERRLQAETSAGPPDLQEP